MYCLYQIIGLSDISEEAYNMALSLMPDERRQAVERLRFEDDRKRTTAGELLARRILSQCCPVRPEDVIFSRTARGKPFAVGLSAHFNVSHSGEYVLCGISDRPIGVDIQIMRPVDDRLISRVCTPRELSYVNECGITDEEKLRRFFLVWGGKEAYFKCLGTGITAFEEADVTDRSLRRGLTQFFRGDYAVSIFSDCAVTPKELY